MLAAGEEDVQQRHVQSRADEADQSGGCRGRRSGELFPRIPRHVGGVALPSGETRRGRRGNEISGLMATSPWEQEPDIIDINNKNPNFRSPS